MCRENKGGPSERPRNRGTTAQAARGGHGARLGARSGDESGICVGESVLGKRRSRDGEDGRSDPGYREAPILRMAEQGHSRARLGNWNGQIVFFIY